MEKLKLGNWADEPCYYVSVVNGTRTALLLGPFKKHDDALNMVEPTREYAYTLDNMSHFYSFGTVKMVDGHRDGKLNDHFMTGHGWDGTCNNLSEC